MTDPRDTSKPSPHPPTGVNDDPAPAADDRPQHEDETLGDLLGDRDPESSSKTRE